MYSPLVVIKECGYTVHFFALVKAGDEWNDNTRDDKDPNNRHCNVFLVFLVFLFLLFFVTPGRVI